MPIKKKACIVDIQKIPEKILKTTIYRHPVTLFTRDRDFRSRDFYRDIAIQPLKKLNVDETGTIYLINQIFQIKIDLNFFK